MPFGVRVFIYCLNPETSPVALYAGYENPVLVLPYSGMMVCQSEAPCVQFNEDEG